MSGAEIFFTILFSLVVVGLLLVVVKLIKYVFRQIKLSFTKPWEDKSKDVLRVEFNNKDILDNWISVYYRVNNVWYKGSNSCYIDKSWDECKMGEPVGTLLTLILEDYQNFNYVKGETNFSHSKLDIYVEDKNLLHMFGHSISVSHLESTAIISFLDGIATDKETKAAELKKQQLAEIREKNTEIVIDEINKYLEDKE
jgi:hypothetical protein